MKSVRIGAAQAFYGDRLKPAIDMANNGGVDYLCFDCLAELTLAILQKDRQKNPEMGFTRDVLPVMTALLPICLRKGIRLITNAGGINPEGAAAAISKVARDLGLSVKIATVVGDDVLPRLADLSSEGVLASMDGLDRDPISALPQMTFANAYLGAQPILDALNIGADVVLTGRSTDTAQYLAAAAHGLGWSLDDLDKAAQGVVLGHVLECTAQASGGNFSGAWWEVEGLEKLGYPLADIYEDGSFVIGKTPGSGGLVSVDTIKEQLLYEIHNPSNFISPDVIIDMTDIRLEQVGPHQVKLTGAIGRPPPPTLKVVGGYPSGFAGEGRMVYTWPDALPKARKAEQLIRQLLVDDGIEVEEFRAEYFGVNAIHENGAAPLPAEPPEVVLRIAVRTATELTAARVGRIFPPLGIAGPPHLTGLSGVSGARALMGVASFLVPRERVEAHVRVQLQTI
jgi:hypothetical protein